MQKKMHIVSGFVKFRFHGEQAERFLNLCRNRGVCFWNLSREDGETLAGCVSVKDFRRFAPLRRKTGGRIHILEKHGLPFFFYRSKKRKAFFAGILLCFFLLFFLSGRIWTIRVDGCQRHTDAEILSFLKEQGIVHGMQKNRVGCDRIAAAIREEFTDISWVSAQLKGVCLLITVREGEFGTGEENGETKACSLAAENSGVIVRMVTRAGTPLKKPGDSCESGEILVTGVLELKNDSQETTGYEYVHADADIYIKRTVSYYDEFPLKYTETVCTGEKKTGWYVYTSGWYFQTGGARDGWIELREESSLKLTESFYLPVTAGRITWKKYREITRKHTESSAKRLSLWNLQLYEEKLMEKGVQISANNVKIETDQSVCKSFGTLDLIHKTGSEIPVEKQEDPVERNTEDD